MGWLINMSHYQTMLKENIPKGWDKETDTDSLITFRKFIKDLPDGRKQYRMVSVQLITNYWEITKEIEMRKGNTLIDSVRVKRAFAETKEEAMVFARKFMVSV